ncbi:hypothetical protein [Antribacter gilvus]|uniref:hypothetical protein n=1 Tax=Antribacter gilvus TaxID=2304675 RepID=UPI000F7759AC|nr:hypothetical protein [Antribacter gilvus]
MSIHDGRDEWATSDEGAAVSAGLQGLAAEMEAGGAEENLIGGLGAMRTRVRRRRVLKQGAIGAGTLAFVGLLAIGASQAVVWDRTDPVAPAVTPSPEPTPTPTMVPEPSPSPEVSSSPTAIPWDVTVQYEAGYRTAGWPESAGVVCGMPVADLASTTAALSLATTGSLEPRPHGEGSGWQLPVRITLASGEPQLVGEPLLLWAQDGVVVDMSEGWHDCGIDIPAALATDPVWEGVATSPSYTTCRPETQDPEAWYQVYDNERPAGRFEVRAATVFDFDGDGVMGLVVSDAIEVTLTDGVGTRAAEATGQPSAEGPAQPAYVPAWLAGGPFECGSPIVDLAGRAAGGGPVLGIDEDNFLGVPLRSLATRVYRGGVPLDGYAPHAQIAWAKDGQVVAFGPAPSGPQERLTAREPGQYAQTTTDVTAVATCTAGATQHDALPPGRYQAVVYLPVNATEAYDPATAVWAVSILWEVDLGADGTVTLVSGQAV